MLKTLGSLTIIMGTVIGGAYILDKLAKMREEMINKQENDEVELDNEQCCGKCKNDKQHKCCGGNCNCCNDSEN